MDTNKADIKGYEGLYAIDRNGNIWSYPKRNGHGLRKGHWMKLYEYRGYMYCRLCKDGKYKNCLVHRLVAQTFLKNPLGKLEVNHINGIKNDNNVENLEWATPSENCQHSYNVGTSYHVGLRGENNGRAKLTNKKVALMRQIKKPHGYWMKRFKISKSVVSSVINRKSWIKI